MLVNTEFVRSKANRKALESFIEENHDTLSELAVKCHRKLGRGFIYVPQDQPQVDYRTTEDADDERLLQLLESYDPESEMVLYWQPKRLEEMAEQYEELDPHTLTDPGSAPEPIACTAELSEG